MINFKSVHIFEGFTRSVKKVKQVMLLDLFFQLLWFLFIRKNVFKEGSFHFMKNLLPLKWEIILLRRKSSLKGRNQAWKWEIKLERGISSFKGINQAWKWEIKPDNSKFSVYRTKFLKSTQYIESIKWLSTIFPFCWLSWIPGTNIEICLSVYWINLWNCWPAEF